MPLSLCILAIVVEGPDCHFLMAITLPAEGKLPFTNAWLNRNKVTIKEVEEDLILLTCSYHMEDATEEEQIEILHKEAEKIKRIRVE